MAFKLKELDNIVKKQIITKRDFGYSFGSCNLNFTLALTEKELNDFKKCLNEAVLNIDEALNNL